MLTESEKNGGREAPVLPVGRTESPDGFEGSELVEKASRRSFLREAGLLSLGATAVLSGCSTGAPKAGGNANRRWGMIIDLKRCVACKACTVACKTENKTPPGVAYGVFLEEESGVFPHVQTKGFFRPCMQCEKSSCTKVCPTKATHHRDDGIVVVDYEKCIGCRYCINACPYGARSFDYGHDYIGDPENDFNKVPSSEYGAAFGLRTEGKSPIGNVRKCTFCLHLQNEDGAYREPPSCARTCMGKAIHFGDLKDPESRCIVHGEKMQEFIARRGHYRLKEELGNNPAVWYLT